MAEVNFAVIILCMGVIAATFVALLLHLQKFYFTIKNPPPRPRSKKTLPPIIRVPKEQEQEQ